MAVHKLGSNEYRDLTFDPNLWKGVHVDSIADLVHDFFPEINSVTSLSQNKAFSWFFGKVKVEGEGEVKVKYPYLDSSMDILTIRNVDFSSFPFINLKAESLEGWVFKGWYDSVTGDELGDSPTLMLLEDSYPAVTGFVAKFVENEDRLGI